MRRRGRLSALAIVGAIGITLLAFYLPPHLAGQRDSSPVAPNWQATAAARTVFVQLLAGFAVAAGAVYAARTYGLTRQTQQNERFSRAVENLGHADSLAVRAGGAYSLYLLATEQAAFWPLAEELLVGFVRQHARAEQAAAGVSADVQAALTVLGRRPTRKPGHKGLPLDLSKLSLVGANLVGANLERANLDDTDLSDANLLDARLAAASAKRCRFDGADLAGADLTACRMNDATFDRTNLFRAEFTGAELSGADLTRARNASLQQSSSNVRNPVPPAE